MAYAKSVTRPKYLPKYSGRLRAPSLSESSNPEPREISQAVSHSFLAVSLFGVHSSGSKGSATGLCMF